MEVIINLYEKITLLGSTGSIGTQALEVIDHLKLTVIAISANSNIKLLESQARKYRPLCVLVTDENFYKELKFNLKDTPVKVLTGEESLCDLATLDQSDMVINSVVGMVGLKPTITALKSGKRVGLANKESLVTGGDLILNQIKYENQLIPIDSEHSAIFQALQGNDKKNINKILLTASGGPFFGKNRYQLENVTVDQALKHPNWSMGKKISIDSATMMNKGLELIEAAFLFNLDPSKIEILIHRESIIHSMIEYIDKSIIAQMSVPDMKIPIQYAISYPDRVSGISGNLDLFSISNLSFYSPDYDTFRALNICIKAAKLGGIYPCLVNAANEEAVESFLNGNIKFTEIDYLIEKTMNGMLNIENPTIEDIFKVDRKARQYVRELVK